jgi:hypothetical protein
MLATVMIFKSLCRIIASIGGPLPNLRFPCTTDLNGPAILILTETTRVGRVERCPRCDGLNHRLDLQMLIHAVCGARIAYGGLESPLRDPAGSTAG